MLVSKYYKYNVWECSRVSWRQVALFPPKANNSERAFSFSCCQMLEYDPFRASKPCMAFVLKRQFDKYLNQEWPGLIIPKKGPIHILPVNLFINSPFFCELGPFSVKTTNKSTTNRDTQHGVSTNLRQG